uniref:NADH-ubiquinone oxidoreductase chain 3 n=1 Tax=Glena unipennaria TaxID=1981046 RepID=A0A343YVI5_9NEOP|nr:NADH dehydrogenase subunit 3 [Glena unipennaria]
MLKMILCITILLIILILILNFISKKTFLDREKCSPFECGFDPKSSSRSPFSLQFFLIAVIFLIFDVEITLLLPMIILMKYTNILNFIMTNMMILLILIMGLIHEWNQGSLNWAI